MLNQTFRPGVYEDVFGQDLNIELLKAITRSPNSSSRSLVFSGSYGSGKTTLARIFAKGLNCKHDAVTKRPCGECTICKDSLVFSPFYQEFDAGSVGNKEAIENLKDSFFASSAVCEWRVIVFDEAHLISKIAQGSLLKVLEEMPPNIFVIFPTTDPQHILDTILSRSIILTFKSLTIKDSIDNLNRIVTSENIGITPELLDYIAISSQGHARDAVKLLELYVMLSNPDLFLEYVKSSEPDIIAYFKAIKTLEDLNPIIERIITRPLDVVRNDLYLALRNMVYAFSGGSFLSTYKTDYESLASMYGQDVLKIFSFSLSDWVTNAFNNDLTAQAFLWAMASKLKPNNPASSTGALLHRATKRS